MIKIDPDPLKEAEKREILKKQKNEEHEKKLKNRLHEMIEQEKKNKDLAKKIFVEKIVCNFQYKSYSNFFDFLIIFLMSLMMEVRRYKGYRLPYLELTEDSPVTTGTTEQIF